LGSDEKRGQNVTIMTECATHPDAKCPARSRIARQVLCLPIYPDLELSTVDTICDFIAEQV
jgi:dTDP-4-amino-4,6-dideoxygalactose transaminase